MSTKVVYVVRGSVGEYSDREEFPVCAYEDEDTAKSHAVAAEAHARAVAIAADEARGYNVLPEGALAPWDEGIDYKYESWYRIKDVSYFVERVEIRGSLPGPIPS